MGSFSKKCPVCKKKRRFAPTGASTAPGHQPKEGWVKSGALWVCKWCVQFKRFIYVPTL